MNFVSTAHQPIVWPVFTVSDNFTNFLRTLNQIIKFTENWTFIFCKFSNIFLPSRRQRIFGLLVGLLNLDHIGLHLFKTILCYKRLCLWLCQVTKTKMKTLTHTFNNLYLETMEQCCFIELLYKELCINFGCCMIGCRGR